MDSEKWKVDSGKRILPYALIAFLSISSLSSFAVRAQLPTDDSIFAAKIKQAKAEKIDTLPIGERVAAMGKLFLGTPYVAHTLDEDATKEELVINLRGFDCVTFYENMVAFARIIKKYTNPTMENLRDELKHLRYRDGKIDGFHSRLNYTIDYLYDACHKEILCDATYTVGGKYLNHDSREINFMTAHRSLYKQLANNDAEFSAMQTVESKILARKGFDYILKDDVSAVDFKIQTGDIVGITTNIEGLDCSHTGIAIRMQDGRIHFMHASSLMGKVIISEESLDEYLTHSSHQTGIIIARPLNVVIGNFKPAFD